MTKTEDLPYYIYRENKGYFYGPGAGPALQGKPMDWKNKLKHLSIDYYPGPGKPSVVELIVKALTCLRPV